jgi:NADH-quinone oxidoreductase subunit J
MTLYSIIFYVLAIVILVATFLAITRRNTVHAVVYLILSFLGTALFFYLLGAPFLAVLEAIIYAGGIMVLFLFIVMMIGTGPSARKVNPVRNSNGASNPAGMVLKSNRAAEQRGIISNGVNLSQWLPVVILGMISLLTAAILLFSSPLTQGPLIAASAAPIEFGRFLFENYWFPVEIASFLLLIALVGTLYLGRQDTKEEKK